ncbi:uncharacterized protein LOC141665894 [Apium graveolens]|uniref:uncharacterized protein LOC141665894 n=1 Tax=Apium graveolens TaxID=4045 RepID=UPI003D7BCD80
MDLDSKKVFISRDVVFAENIFPFKTISTSTSSHLFNSDVSFLYDPLYGSPPDANTSLVTPESSSSSLSPTPHPISSHYLDIQGSSQGSIQTSSSPVVPLRHSTRSRTVPTKFLDFVGLPSRLGSSVNNFTVFEPQYQDFTANITHIPEPTSYKIACQHSVWCQAMAIELAALEANKTWKIVPLPPGKRVVSCKWIYKVKFNQDGTVERYKARLIARGFTQT